MSPRDLVYIGHMLDMATKAAAQVQDLPRQMYDADENLRLALIHRVDPRLVFFSSFHTVGT
jgi:hypothetical protein